MSDDEAADHPGNIYWYQAQRANYFTIYDRLVKSLMKGLGPDEALQAEPAKGLNPAWGEPTQFLTMAFKSLWGHVAADA